MESNNATLTDDQCQVGRRCLTKIGSKMVEVQITAIREPMTFSSWTSANQNRRVYQVKRAQGLALASREYKVRQAHQLFHLSSDL